MKRVMAMVLTVALIAALLCTPVAAAQSKENLVEVKEVENVTVAVSKEPDIKKVEVVEAFTDMLKAEETKAEVEKAFEEAGMDAAKATVVSVLSQKEVKVAEGKEAQMTVTVDGVKDVKVAVFLKLVENGVVKYKLLKVGEPPLKVKFSESGTLVTTVVR